MSFCSRRTRSTKRTPFRRSKSMTWERQSKSGGLRLDATEREAGTLAPSRAHQSRLPNCGLMFAPKDGTQNRSGRGTPCSFKFKSSEGISGGSLRSEAANRIALVRERLCRRRRTIRLKSKRVWAKAAPTERATLLRNKRRETSPGCPRAIALAASSTARPACIRTLVSR